MTGLEPPVEIADARIIVCGRLHEGISIGRDTPKAMQDGALAYVTKPAAARRSLNAYRRTLVNRILPIWHELRVMNQLTLEVERAAVSLRSHGAESVSQFRPMT